MIYIYGLLDPFTFKVRYIGKSIRPKQRLTNQCNEKSKTHRCNWIQNILRCGRKPIQIILQELDDKDDWQKVERRWIFVAKKYGWSLVNTTDGGDGVLNLSGESKMKMIATWKGRKHKPESIEKMRKANIGRKYSFSTSKKHSLQMKKRKITWADKLQKANRKFTDEQLININKELKNGMSVIELALKYNVHRTTISKIKAGTYKTFKQKTVNYVKPRLYHSLKEKTIFDELINEQ